MLESTWKKAELDNEPRWEILFLEISVDTGDSNPGVHHVGKHERNHCHSKG